MANRHGMTGAPLQQPDPEPLRRFAAFDSDQPCREHSTAYSGSMPCTGDYRCYLCGTVWDDDGKVLGARPPVADNAQDARADAGTPDTSGS